MEATAQRCVECDAEFVPDNLQGRVRMRCYRCSPTRNDRVRDERGRIQQGVHLPVRHRKAISRGQVARARRIDAEHPRPTRYSKKCTKCGVTKTVDLENRDASDFLLSKRHLPSGIRYYPKGECRYCNSERARLHREKLTAEGTFAEQRAKWEANRRERQKKPKPAPEPESQVGPDRVPVAPFVEWFEEWLAITGRNVEKIMKEAGSSDKQYRRWRDGDMAEIDFYLADRILVIAGMQHLLYTFWPDA